MILHCHLRHSLESSNREVGQKILIRTVITQLLGYLDAVLELLAVPCQLLHLALLERDDSTIERVRASFEEVFLLSDEAVFKPIKDDDLAALGTELPGGANCSSPTSASFHDQNYTKICDGKE